MRVYHHSLLAQTTLWRREIFSNLTPSPAFSSSKPNPILPFDIPSQGGELLLLPRGQLVRSFAERANGAAGGFGMWSMISTHATGLEFGMGWDSWLAWETIPLPTRSIGGVWSPALYWVRFRCGLVGRGFPLNRKCWHPAPLQPPDTHRENSCANFYHSYKRNPWLLLSLGMPWNHSWHDGQCAACAATYLTYVCR